MSRSTVKVLLRTRPSQSMPAEQQFFLNTDSKFKFDGLLHHASQQDVFEMCAADVIQSALQGYNGTVMCYGQTGSGKTYTMTGNRQSFAERGLVPRFIAATLQQLGAAPGLSSWRLGVSYLEIYNEALFDLLDLNTQPHELSLYEDGRGFTQVAGLRRVEVSSESQALALFFEGETNRVIGEHQLNRESSRSHSIFMLQLVLVKEGQESQETVSKVCLVDLAGSERVSKTRSEGLVLREAGHINKSLHILEQVVLAAGERGRDHVPYRSSKLTHVLKDSLGGNCKTILIANVWEDPAQLDETLSTCRFAARMARLVCEVRSNVVAQGGATVRALERAKLREAVVTWLQQPDVTDAGADGGGSSSSSSPSLLSGLPLGSVRQLRELLLTFRQSLSPEEYQLLVAVRDIKAQYRDEVSYTTGLLDTCKAELAAHYQDWLRGTYGVVEPDQLVEQGGLGASVAAGPAALWAGSTLSSRPDSSSSLQVTSAVQSISGSVSGTPSIQRRQQQASQQRWSISSSSRLATPPLASLVGSLEDNDPQAAAFYQAQQAVTAGRGGSINGHRQKHRAERGTFSLSERTFDESRADVEVPDGFRLALQEALNRQKEQQEPSSNSHYSRITLQRLQAEEAEIENLIQKEQKQVERLEWLMEKVHQDYAYFNGIEKGEWWTSAAVRVRECPGRGGGVLCNGSNLLGMDAHLAANK
eukprot:gene1708-2053_t